MDVDTGSKKQRRHSRVKVHRGFHTSWRLNGMREKVVDLIRSEVCPDEAAARRMKVLFTGEGWPAGDVLQVCLCVHSFVHAGLFLFLQDLCGAAPQHNTTCVYRKNQLCI